jgi:acetyl-CoA synthetase
MSGAASRYRYTLRKLSFTGEPIDGDSLEFAERTFGTRLCSMYGTTEVGVILANYPGAEDFSGRPGALGVPVPGVTAEVQRPDGSACAPGEIGEIKVWRHGTWFPTKDRGWDRCRWLLLPRRPRGRRDHIRRLDDERDRDRGRAAASSSGA